MKNLLLGLMMLLAFGAFAQSTHTIDFEPAGVGSGWDWTAFDFAPSLTEIANPVSGGINTSGTVMEFIAAPSDQPWTGAWTIEDGEFTFDASNSTVSIMVHKDVISIVKIKFEGFSAPIEVDATNTGTGAWEMLTYDFSGAIGNTYDKIIIFPDFNFARTAITTSYFDNIQVPDGVITGPLPEPTTVPPTPPHAAADVISIYSETYTDVPGTDFNPNWGQSTTVTVDYVAAGNNTLKYENLNYQGTQFTSQNVSLYENLHVDFWTPNSTDLGIYLISPGNEVEYVFTVVSETWVSVDIPLTDFAPPVNLADVFQFKVEGVGTVYFDNWYFWKTPAAADATLSDLQVDGTTVDGFSPSTLSYDVELPYGTTIVPTVTATPNDPVASHVVNPAASLPGTTTVVVTADDGITMLTYNVNFTVAGPEPTTVPPTPPHAAADVISIYSDSYTAISGINYNPPWGQTTIVTVDYIAAGNNTLRYENLNYQGTDWNGNPQDVSGHEFLHIDFWTANSTDLGIYLVSGVWPTNVEFEYVFTVQTDQWVSVDIPLTYFSGGGVDLADARQFKVEGDGDVYLDNLYFWKTPASTSAIWTGAAKSYDWHTPGNWNPQVVPGATTDVTIPAGLDNYPTISASADCNNIAFGSIATSTATLLDNGFLTIHGTATVDRYFTGNTTDWHLVSSPISNAIAGVFTDMYLQSFDETSNLYTEISDENMPLDPGTGYAVYSTLGVANTVSFAGSMNTGSQLQDFTANNQGWNLMGNPFVSSIDWESVSIPGAMSNEVHYIDAATGNDLSYVQGSGGPGSQYVPPMQGFFVEATGAGTLTLDDAARSHDGAGTFYKGYNPNLVILEASNGLFADQAWVHFNEQAGVEHDGTYDAYKRISLSNPQLPQLFSVTPGGSNLSINGMPEIAITPIGFTAVESGEFTINAIESGDFANVYLKDLFTNTLVDLLNNSYTFSYTSGEPVNRFELHFNTVGIDNTNGDIFNIYSYKKNIYVAVPENTNGTIAVYDIMGREIAQTTISNSINIISLNKSAYYIVKVISNESVVTKKILIK